MRKLIHRSKRGDTIIEVLFATTIFCVVAVSCIGLMNSTLASAEGTLESTMVRNEIDAQAEAIRFARNSYITAKNNGVTDLGNSVWSQVTANPYQSNEVPDFQSNCADNKGGQDASRKAFVLNTHDLKGILKDDERDNKAKIVMRGDNDKFNFNTPVYSRVLYNDNTNAVSDVQGIWAIAVKSDISNDGQPQFYDFYIRACWNIPGRNTSTMLGTLIRLNNPDYRAGGSL